MKYFSFAFKSVMLLGAILGITSVALVAQDGYKTPSQAMINLVDGDRTPSISFSSDNSIMLLMEQPGMPSIEEVSQPELRLAGIRINPRTNGRSRAGYSTGLTLRDMSSGKDRTVANIPANARISNVSWSPDNKSIAFLNTTNSGIDIWIADVATASAKKLSNVKVNATMGSAMTWSRDGNSLLVQAVPANRGAVPEQDLTPTGPVIQESSGKATPARTYQDLLANSHDEALFDYYFTSEIVRVNLNGTTQKLTKPAIYNSMSLSPDGNYILAQSIEKPYSYLVPASRFPSSIDVLGKDGTLVYNFAKLPLADNIPIGFSATSPGPRSVNWRNDAPATLTWVQALDGGDPYTKADKRDRLLALDAPFNGQPKTIVDLAYRYSGVFWSEDGFALVNEYWWADRHRRTWKINPDDPSKAPKLVFDMSSEDRYNDPGTPEFKRSKFGTAVLHTTDKGKSILLTGTGATPEGNRPFLRKMNIDSQKMTEVWRSEAPYYEYVVSVMDDAGNKIITRQEQVDVAPNYYIRDLKKKSAQQLTFFEHPTPELKDVHKELIQYTRADGVNLTATLFLPPNYNKERDGKLPTLVWAYPREFRSADAAGQVSDSPYRFTRLSHWGPHFALLEGYAVVENAAMPIIGEGDNEPNDLFVEQLVSSAQAVVDEIDRRGVGDPERVAVGGHSYGAFMTANLLSHSDIFRAGIARSGAYNRTLTPFGFQSEQRTFWEAPDIYFEMSPFMHADKLDEPIIFIHGINDNNSGTFPMQSERMYAAVSGHGGVARLVMLPNESHGYAARESVLHMLYEQTEWLNKYVKNAEPRTIKREKTTTGGER